MSWVLVGTTTALSAISAYATMDAQNKQAQAQIDQGQRDMIASQSATEQAEADLRDEQALELSDLASKLLGAESAQRATSANSGVAGITAERNMRNIQFQNTFDVNQVNTKNERLLIGIRNSGFNNASSIQGGINEASSRKTSRTAMAVNTTLSGGKAFISSGGLKGLRAGKKGGKTSG